MNHTTNCYHELQILEVKLLFEINYLNIENKKKCAFV